MIQTYRHLDISKIHIVQGGHHFTFCRNKFENLGKFKYVFTKSKISSAVIL